MSLPNEISNMIDHYKHLVDCLNRAIGSAADHDHECDGLRLMARKMAYERDMIPDLEKLLEIAEAGKDGYLPEGEGR